MSQDMIVALASLIALVLAVTTHEAAHGFMAKAFGDRTAESMGRLTLNPIPHIDLFGTIILPGLMFMVGTPSYLAMQNLYPLISAISNLNDWAKLWSLLPVWVPILSWLLSQHSFYT